MYKSNCDGNGENCTSSWVNEYNDAGKQTMSKWSCDGNGIKCRNCSNNIAGSCKKNSAGYYDPEDTVYDD